MLKKIISIIQKPFQGRCSLEHENEPKTAETTYRPNRFINLSRNFEYDALIQPEEVEKAIEEHFRPGYNDGTFHKAK